MASEASAWSRKFRGVFRARIPNAIPLLGKAEHKSYKYETGVPLSNGRVAHVFEFTDGSRLAVSVDGKDKGDCWITKDAAKVVDLVPQDSYTLEDHEKPDELLGLPSAYLHYLLPWACPHDDCWMWDYDSEMMVGVHIAHHWADWDSGEPYVHPKPLSILPYTEEGMDFYCAPCEVRFSHSGLVGLCPKCRGWTRKMEALYFEGQEE